MKKLNIPSFSWLSLKENLLHAIQSLYEVINTLASPIQAADITALSSDVVAGFTLGDTVIESDGSKQYSYVVSYKDDTAGELSLVYTDHINVVEVHYEKTGDTWAYASTDTVTF